MNNYSESLKCYFSELCEQLDSDTEEHTLSEAYLTGFTRINSLLKANLVHRDCWLPCAPGLDVSLLMDTSAAINEALEIVRDFFNKKLATDHHRAKRAIFSSLLTNQMDKLGLGTNQTRSRYQNIHKKAKGYSDDLSLGGFNYFQRWWKDGYIPDTESLNYLAEALKCEASDLCPWLNDNLTENE